MLLNPDTGKMIISRDVTFDEQGVWDLTKKVTDSTPKYPPMPFYLDEGNSSNQPVEQSRQHTGDSSFSGVQSNLVQSSNRPQREHCMPARLKDYVVGNDNELFDEDIVKFALFVN